MNELDRKMFRDLWRMRTQAIAICLVVASGIATFAMSVSTLDSLESMQESYYHESRFASIFTHLKRAPNVLRQRIAAIPGVARVQTRIVADVTLDVPDLDEPAVGRLISIPDQHEPSLNSLYLRQGRYIEFGRRGEVLVNEAFAEAHGFQPGDTVDVVINGKWQRLRIVGIAMSPEYILQIREGDVWPDEKRFGVFWMSEKQLSAAYNMEGAFNDVTLALMRGTIEADVIDRLDRLTMKYGSAGAYSRSEQLSHRYLYYEILGLRAMAAIGPTIFLSVAAFLLNIVVSRIVGVQREQIAALKSFGFTNWEVGIHYIKFVLLICTVGVLAGTAVGAWLGTRMTTMYAHFYRFPQYDFEFRFAIILLSFALTWAAALIGTFRSVKHAVNLPPAEAMRPEPPARYRPTVLERLGIGDWLSPTIQMIARRLERQPWQAIFSCLGISLAVAVLVLGNFMEDSLSGMIELQFSECQREDMTLAFVEPTSGAVAFDIRHSPGVLRAEVFRSVPARMRVGHRDERLAIMGLPPDGELFRLVGQQHRVIDLPQEGVVISEKLAQLLHTQVGDTVTVEILAGTRPVFNLEVTSTIADYAGLNVYMDIGTLRRRLFEGDTVSGAFLQVDPTASTALFRRLKSTPQVASVLIKRAAIESFHETIEDNLRPMRISNIIFASIIAFGVVYNTARVSLAERSRELGTLRVLGFTRSEIANILLGELLVVTLAALPLGMATGYGFSALTVKAFDFDVYRIPLIVTRRTYTISAVVTLLAAACTAYFVRCRIYQLDLISVLKSRE